MGIFLSVFLLEGPGGSYIIANSNVSSRKESPRPLTDQRIHWKFFEKSKGVSL